MTKNDITKFRLPDAPGVYMFRGKGGPARLGKILYIGKATSLRDRVRSYFSTDLGNARSPTIVQMVDEARRVTYEETGSVLEALILEANLIKRYQPLYNVEQKDNKSFNYLVITKEEFPRVIVVRGRDLYQKWSEKDIKYVFGPYPTGASLKEVIKKVRKIFPFRNTCAPAPAGGSGRPCFNRQIGLCPGVCTGEVSSKEYAKTVRNIRELFLGHFKGLKRKLAQEMRAYAADEQFEKAAKTRRQIVALEHVRDVSLIRDETRVSSGGGVRVEAFDVAHTSGTATVAVMTVVSNGEAVKVAYRKFNIRTATNDDVAALQEALERRLGHTEWPLPRVLVVDGGTAQMHAAQRVLKKAGIVIPIVGVVKNQFHKPERLVGNARAIEAYERDILLANNEAHRFAITWHRKRRERLT